MFVYTFWEPHDQIPYYLQLCMETWKKFLPNATIVLLDYKNIGDFIDVRETGLKLFSDKITLQVVSDAIRVAILAKHGGVWLDADTIILNSDAEKYFLPDENHRIKFFGPPESQSVHIAFINAPPVTMCMNIWHESIREKLWNLKSSTPVDWDFFGNTFINDYMKTYPNEIKLFSADYVIPERKLISDSMNATMAYIDYYFLQNHHLADVDADMLLLHNSWTPPFFKQMSPQDFFSFDCTMVNVLAEALDIELPPPLRTLPNQNRKRQLVCGTQLYAAEILTHGKNRNAFRYVAEGVFVWQDGAFMLYLSRLSLRREIMPKISFDAAMYFVVLLMAFAVPLSTAAASIAVGLGTLFIIVHSVRARKFPTFDAKILEVLAVYIVCQIFTAITSWNPSISLREVVGEVHRFFPLIFAMTFIKRREQLGGVLIATLLASLINDAAGIFQCLVQGAPRAYGFNHTPTFYGSFMLIQLPVMIFIAQSEFLSPLWRRLALVGAGLSLICLVLSMTRGAWLALVACVVIFVVPEKKYRRMTAKICAGLAIVFVIVAAMSPKIQDRLTTLTDANFQSNSERLLMWQSAVEIFRDHPIYGVGQKMFFTAYNEQYISPEAKERPGDGMRGHTHPHNNFLHRASEGGLIGLLSFVGLYAYFFWKFFRQFRRERRFAFGAGMTAFMILAALQLEGLTDTNMNQVPIMREFWLIAGTMLAADNILNRGESV